MNIPSIYRPGFQKARKLNAQLAKKYIEYTMVGDPLADAATEALMAVKDKASRAKFIHAGMNQHEELLKHAPAEVRTFFSSLDSPPVWFSPDDTIAGCEAYNRNSGLVLLGTVLGSLIRGFASTMTKSFLTRGRIIENGTRRLQQNSRHIMEIFLPGGLDRSGDGLKTSVRIRLIHAHVRSLLKNCDEWDVDHLGLPVHAAHCAYSATLFSAGAVYYSAMLGATFNSKERKSFMDIWRYALYLTGVPENILFQGEDDAWEFAKIAELCEPTPPDEDCIIMTNSMIHSIFIATGIKDEKKLKSTIRMGYRLSRALLGNDLVDKLNFPKYKTWGVLPLFRVKVALERLTSAVIPKWQPSYRVENIDALLNNKTFLSDLSYKMPDHAYDELSSKW